MDSGLSPTRDDHNRGMPRIDPAHPPLWRTARTLQFGLDAVCVVDDPAPWQQRLVRELERGIPDGAVVPFAIAAGASALAAETFLRELEPALAGEETRARVVVLQAAGDVPASHLDTVARAMTAAGCTVQVAHEFDPPGAGVTDAATLVVVAHGLVAPAFVARLMAEDVSHLPIVIAPSDAQIGPLVVPGETSCLSCQAAHRRDTDEAWPAIAAQLLGRPAPEVDASLLWEAGIVAARLLSAAGRSRSRWDGRSMTVRSGSLRRVVRTHRPHGDCRCRSLAGSETAAAPVVLEPRRPRAFARPA